MSGYGYPVHLTPGVELAIRRLLDGGGPVPMAELLAFGNENTMMGVLAYLQRRASVIEVAGQCKWGGKPGRFVADPDQAAVTLTDEPGLRTLLRVWPREPRLVRPASPKTEPKTEPKPLQLVQSRATVTGHGAA